jgi:hypothetical protein
MRAKWFLLPLPLLLLASAAVAQDAGSEKPYDFVAAFRKVAELMRETEGHLVESIASRPEAAPAEAAASGERTREAIDRLLRKGRDRSGETVDKIQEIIDNAPT